MSADSNETTILDSQLREAGFSPQARDYPRDEIAFRLLCAFNGVTPEQAPAAWRFHANAATQAAWQRVADEASAIFGARPQTQKAAAEPPKEPSGNKTLYLG